MFIYDSKISESDLLTNVDKVYPIKLKIDKSYIKKEYNWNNIIFSGDNLEFLKTLYLNTDEIIAGKIKGKVKLIYIDPPFGTGEEYSGNKGQKGYSAKLKGTEFIEFIRKRLILAREILSDSGFIFVRQAYNFGHYIKIILDEVFGLENFKNEIIISRKRQSMGSKGKFEIQNESLFVYSKNPSSKLKNIYVKRPLTNFKWTGFLKQENRNPKQRTFFGKELIPPEGQHFSLVQEKVDKLLREHYLRLKCRSCGAIYYHDQAESNNSLIKKIFTKKSERFKYLDIKSDSDVYGITNLNSCLKCNNDNFRVEYLPSDDLKLNNIWLDIPSYTDSSGYPSENSEELLTRVISCASEENDLVMDFFGGSGSTIIASEKLNRRWIYCDYGKLAQATVLKRLLQIRDSKDLFKPKLNYNKDPENFIILKKEESFSKNSFETPILKNGFDEYVKNNPAEIKSEVKKVQNNLMIRIDDLTSNEIHNKKNNLNGIHSFYFALLDKNHNKFFNIDEYYFPDKDFYENRTFILDLSSKSIGERICMNFYDIYGNEVQQQFSINNLEEF